jgi:cytochrome c2
MPLRRNNLVLLAAALLLVAIAVAIVANHRSARAEQRERDAAHGATLFAAKGCGGCHTLHGAAQASGKVGPPLDGVAGRAVIAGALENTPDNMARWIADPQGVVPGNAMPDLMVSRQEARDINAFLDSES